MPKTGEPRKRKYTTYKSKDKTTVESSQHANRVIQKYSKGLSVSRDGKFRSRDMEFNKSINKDSSKTKGYRMNDMKNTISKAYKKMKAK